MPLLGKAALAMWWDVTAARRTEFEDWHSHEHFPERLRIPGFLRASRWASATDGEGCFVMYELDALETLTSQHYLARLNDPTPWSARMMPHHRNMVRGLCRVEASGGTALGQALATIRFAADGARSAELLPWMRDTLAALPQREGLVAAALLRDTGRAPARETTEQRLRGGDAAPECIALLSGYRADTVAAVVTRELGEDNMRSRGAAPGRVAATYRLAFALAATGYTGRPEEAR